MKIDYDHQSGVTVIPDGLFDYSTGSDCVQQVEQYIRTYGAIQITFDFCNTTFMDSSGIGALIILMRALPNDAPQIKLVHPSKSIQKLMEICHLDKLFIIRP